MLKELYSDLEEVIHTSSQIGNQQCEDVKEVNENVEID